VAIGFVFRELHERVGLAVDLVAAALLALALFGPFLVRGRWRTAASDGSSPAPSERGQT
jgi:hypothetical protein